jgi:hypothetical protein
VVLSPNTEAFLRSFPANGVGRCRAAAARMDDVLEVWLHRPTFPYLILIDRREKSLKVSQRPLRIDEGSIVQIESLCPLRDVGVTCCDAELVVRTIVSQTDKFDACIGVEIDQVAIGRPAGGPGEHTDAAVVAPRDAIDLLFKDRPAADIAGQQ